jgi:D-alanyl-D-alanine carboxypeptidase/D-alanyl-D-alanine-endopeptidase (penicillin-binding protein 4)
LKNAAISIYVAETKTGRTLVASEPQLCLTPASVLKLVTTATAIEMLGSDFRFQTVVQSSGKLENNILHGDLEVIGGGDPTLGSSWFNYKKAADDFLNHWAQQIKSKGIDTITGNIVVDPNLYTDQEVPGSWTWEDMGQYYGAPAQGIALYDNTMTLEFETGPEGSPAILTGTKPAVTGIDFQNEVRASAEQRDRAYVFGSPYEPFRIIRGTLPQNRKHFEVRSSLYDPAQTLANDFTLALKSAGVIVMGNPQKSSSGKKIADGGVLYIHQSPTLTEIIKPLNQHSINLFAEHLCKHLGYSFNGEGSTPAGVKAITEYWKTRKIDVSSMFIADGSGLSRMNAITAKTLTDILVEMYKSPLFEQFYQSIPLAGKEGTMQYYFNQTPLSGKARIKSGSMTRVRSFAGYTTTKKGTGLAFAVIVNNYSCQNATLIQLMEQLVCGLEETL